MRLVCGLMMVLLPLSALAQPKAPARPERAKTPALIPVAVLPPASEGEQEKMLALLIQTRAAWLLEGSGRHADLHLKQILAMAAGEGIDSQALGSAPTAARAATMLGATRHAFATLRAEEAGWTLELTVVKEKGAGRSTKTKLPASFAEAVEGGGFAIARAVAALDGVKLPAPPVPMSTSAEAMLEYGRCHEVLIRQPISIEAPTVLGAEALARAVDACKRALEKDPELSAARAALGLAHALSSNDAAAIEALGPLSDEQRLPLHALARFWLVTRYQSNEAGLAVLRGIVDRRPGLLLFRGYHAELLNVLGRHEEAQVAWREYLAITPKSPFLLTRLGKTLARLGRHEEAIEQTRKAQAIAPQSQEVALQLASRFIDRGDFDGAIQTLQPLAAAKDARGEVLLRLGFALLKQDEKGIDAAEQLFKRAAERATAPGEWRTRARANYDLALVAARRGRKDEASAYLLAATGQGYRPRTLDPELQPFAKADAAGLKKEGTLQLKPSLAPREASPFQIDAFGELEVNKPKPPPPRGFEILRFPG